MLCDKNFKCKKDTEEWENNFATLEKCHSKTPETKNKTELCSTFDERQKDGIVCQPNFSNCHRKKKDCNHSHSCCPEQKVNFDNQTSSLRFSPSFNLQTNKKSTPLPTCKKHIHFKNCNQTAQTTQTQQTTNLPTSSIQTVVDIEPTSHFDTTSNASFHST